MSGEAPRGGKDTPRADEELYASLRNPTSDSGTNTYAARDQQGWYVIIGRGPAAWFNHLSLLGSDWGKRRLGGLNVMHIGFKEPWAQRGNERMGQWPRMLDLYRRFDAELALDSAAYDAPEDWLPSRHFADMLKKAEAYIARQYKSASGPKLEIRDGFVGVIEEKNQQHAAYKKHDAAYWKDGVPRTEGRRRRGCKNNDAGAGYVWENKDCRYRLSVFKNGILKYIYAHKVDVCTSFGVARLFDESLFADKNLYEEHLPQLDREPINTEFRRIMDGNVFIGSPNDKDRVVLVYKGNPVGAQSVQSALDMPKCGKPSKRVWFVGNNPLYNTKRIDANVPGARNMLEMIGASPYDKLPAVAKQELDDNYKDPTAHYRTYELFSDKERADLLLGKLFRADCHALLKVSEGGSSRLLAELSGRKLDAPRDAKEIDEKVSEASVQQLLSEFAAIARRDSLTTEYRPEELTLASDNKTISTLKVDQLVFALGQQNDSAAEGSAGYLVQLLGTLRIIRDLATSQFPLGITDSNEDKDVGECGCVRILGAAAARAPGLSGGDAKKLIDGHAEHGDTLPKECPAGGGGMNVNFPCIWRANRYQHKKPPLNTASPEEMVAAGISPGAARFIVAARSSTVRGYTPAEMSNEMLKWVDSEHGDYSAFRDDASMLESVFTF